MNAYESRKGAYFATPPVQLIYALNTSLKQITAIPLETRFQQHKETSNRVKDALEAMGLKFVGYLFIEPLNDNYILIPML